jgi:hypothetical protein
VACILLGLQISLTIVFALLRRNTKQSLDKIIKQDCQLLDKSKVTVFDYFNIPMNGNQPQLYSNTRGPEQDPNTTRQLNSPQKTLHPLAPTLNQGENRLQLHNAEHELDNVDAIGNTVDYGTTNGNNNVKIFNNFIDNTKVGPTVIQRTPNTNVTMRDYESLTLQERLANDNRTFTRYLWDSLVRRNIVISIIFKHSILDPTHLRIAKLIFSLSLIFGFNALLYTDNYIEYRAVNQARVSFILTYSFLSSSHSLTNFQRLFYQLLDLQYYIWLFVGSFIFQLV